MKKRTYLSGPAIAALRACSGQAASKHMAAGHFGRLLWRGRCPFAAQEKIEERLGRTFAPEQIARAVAGLPHRILEINLNEEGHVEIR